MENGRPLECAAKLYAAPPQSIPTYASRKRVVEATLEYIERSKQKSHKTYLGYRTAVNLFFASCRKTYFDQICRDNMLDFLHDLRTRPSRETGNPIGESTVFNYFDEVNYHTLGLPTPSQAPRWMLEILRGGSLLSEAGGKFKSKGSQIVQFGEPDCGLYFDWGPDSSRYLSHIDKRPPLPNEDFLELLNLTRRSKSRPRVRN
jgi:hypothetical protein